MSHGRRLVVPPRCRRAGAAASSVPCRLRAGRRAGAALAPRWCCGVQRALLPALWLLTRPGPSPARSNLRGNAFSGRIPERWAWGQGFQEVVQFDVSRNQLSGPFPGVAYTNTSFMRMQSLCAAHSFVLPGVGVADGRRRL